MQKNTDLSQFKITRQVPLKKQLNKTLVQLEGNLHHHQDIVVGLEELPSSVTVSDTLIQLAENVAGASVSDAGFQIAQAQTSVTPSSPATQATTSTANTQTTATKPAEHILKTDIPDGTEIGMIYHVETGGGTSIWSVLGGIGVAGGIAAAAGGKKTVDQLVAPVTSGSFSLSGVVADGKVKNAKIFVDVNNNGIADPTGATGLTTDANGNFSGSSSINPAGHALLAVGGINIDTGLPNKTVLMAPAGSTVINPLTTLLQSTMVKNPTLNKVQAETKVLTGLGLTLPTGQSVTTYDPLAALQTNAGDATALAAQKAAAQIVAIADKIAQSDATAIKAAQNGDFSKLETTYEAVFAAIATTVASQTSAFDLSSNANITTILTNDGIISPATATPLATTISNNTWAIGTAATPGAISSAQLSAAPSQPVIVNVGTDAIVSANEIGVSTLLSITPPVGESITSVFVSGISKTSGSSVTISATSGATGWTFDSTGFKDGALTVSFNTQDAAGNINPSLASGAAGSYTNTLQLTSAPALTATGSYINKAEATTATVLNLQIPSTDTVNSVTISGTDKTGAAKTVTAAPGTTAGTATFDATGFADGVLNIAVKTASNPTTGYTGTLTLDTAPPATPTLATTSITRTQVTTTTAIQLSPASNTVVNSVQVSGVDKTTSAPLTVTATGAGSNWVFDATGFAQGNLSVTVNVSSSSGNTASSNSPLFLNLGAVALLSGNNIINSSSNYSSSTLIPSLAAGESISSITITGKDSTGATVVQNAVSTVFQTATTWTFNPTAFADGNLSVVVAIQSGTAAAVNQPAITWIKNTVAPSAPTVLSGTDAIISLAEISTATALKVTPAAAGDVISAVAIRATNKTGGSTTLNATKDASGNWVFDSTSLKDGAVSVAMTVSNTAGNTSNSTVMLTLTTSPALTATGLYINKAEAITATVLNLQTATSDTVNSVTISGTSKAGVANTVVNATLGTGANAGTATFDATQFADGSLTVVEKTAANPTTGYSGALTLKTAAPPAPTSVTAWNWILNSATVDRPNATNTTQINVGFDATAIQRSVTITGVDKTSATNAPLTLTATGAAGIYSFDATKFADGALTVNTLSTDAAGNATNASNTLTLNTSAVILNSYNASTGYISSASNSTTLSLATYLKTGESITSVVISGKDSTGAAKSVTVTPTATGALSFDSTVFADGNLSAVVSLKDSTGVVTAQPAVTWIKDTVAPTAPTVVSSNNDALITLGEISSATTIKITPTTSGDTVASVSLTGTLKTGVATTPTVTQSAAGNWVFDATQFSDGNITVNVNLKDAAGNTSSFSPVLALTTSPALTATGLYINKAEAITATVLNLQTATSDTVNSVTISGTSKAGVANTVVNATLGTGANAGTATFDATQFADGSLTVVEKTAANPTTGYSGALTLKTAAPPAPTSVTAWNWILNSATVDRPHATNATQINVGFDATAIQRSVTITGVDKTSATNAPLTLTATGAAGIYSFDATKFADGALTVNTLSTDAAGNATNASNTLLLNTSLVALNTGGVVLNQAANSGFSALNVFPSTGDTVSSITVAGKDLTGNTISVAATGTGTYWTYNSLNFAEGALTVTVTTKNTANVATTQPVVSFTKDTVAPGDVSVLAGTDANLSLAKIGTASVLTITTPTGTTVSSVAITGVDATSTTGATKMVNATLGGGGWVFDATVFKDGVLTVVTTNSTASGNTSVTTSYLNMSRSPVTVGGDTYVNLAENGTATALAVQLKIGDTLTSVTVSGADATGTAITRTATITSATAGTATFDSSGFVDGTNNLTVTVVTSNSATGAAVATTTTSFLSKDTVTPNPATMANVNYNQSNISTQSGISIYYDTARANNAVTAVTVSGISKATGAALTLNASTSGANNFNNWLFDATKFADGSLTFNITTKDLAGNLSYAQQVQNLYTGALTVGNDQYINASENSTATLLTPYLPAGYTLNNITLTGLSPTGTSVSKLVTPSATTSLTFDATAFGEGTITAALSVTNAAGVISTISTSLIKDTVAPVAPTVQVVGSVVVNTLEIGAATPLTITPATGERVTAITISGTDKISATNAGLTVNASLNASGNWVFDSSRFKDGNLTVATTMSDLAGNTSSPASTLQLTNSPALVGGDAYINRAEATTATTLSLLLAAGDTLSTAANAVTVTGLVGGVSTTVNATVGTGAAAGTATFNATQFADGSLTVTVISTLAPTGKTGTLTLDTVLPVAQTGAIVDQMNGYAAIVNPSTADMLSIPYDGAGIMSSVSVTGVDKVTHQSLTINLTRKPNDTTAPAYYQLDSTRFANGELTVNSVAADAAGNKLNYSGNVFMNSVAVSDSNAWNWSSYAHTSGTATYVFIANPTGAALSAVSITGLGATSGVSTTVAATSYTSTTGGNIYSFASNSFADGALTVSATTTAGTALTLSNATLIKNTTAAAAGVSAPVVDYTKVAAMNLANGGVSSIVAPFLFATAATNPVTVTGVSSGAPFTAVWDTATNSVKVTANATGAGYGSVMIAGTDAAGNVTAADFQVAVTSASVTVVGATTTTDAFSAATVAGATVSAASSLYDASALTTAETFNINGTNTNSVIKGGTGADVFQLNFATMDFAQINGGGGTALDTVQLTSKYPVLNLANFNHAGQQAIQQIEVIDMATDPGANKVTLRPGDLFLMHSHQMDAVNTITPTLTIKGGANDTVDMLTGGFTLSGAANGFSTTGAALTNGGYSKYLATYVDGSGNHQVEVLLQNGVAVI